METKPVFIAEEQTTPEATEQHHLNIGKPYTKKIAVPLSGNPDKQIAAAQEIARLERAVKALEEDKKATVKDLSDSITSAKTRIQELAKQIENDTVTEDVQVYDVVDYDDGEVRTVREDTDEVIEKRPLKDDERQAQLPLTPDAEEPIRCCNNCRKRTTCEDPDNDPDYPTDCDSWAERGTNPLPETTIPEVE